MVDTKGSRVTLIVFSVAIVCLIIALTLGLVLHFTLNSDSTPAPVNRISAVGNCIPQGTSNETECNRRSCVWRVTADGSPNCTFPSEYGYRLSGAEPSETYTGFSVELQRIDTPQLYSENIDNVHVDVTYETNSCLRIKFTDARQSRYEVPKEAVDITFPPSLKPTDNETRLYDVTWVTQPSFGLRVIRRSTKAVVFDSTTPGFVFSDQYIQFTNKLPSDNVYGFGEHNHRQFKHNMNWKKWTIFTRDVAPVDEWNLYGAQTFYMNVEKDGHANGVFLLNSNAMDVMLQPNPFPAVTYHVIGGILDFYVFLGPTPENVVQQYTLAVGRPLMPPYWALGFQLSRWNYNSLENVERVVDRNLAANIPLDVQYGDIDYMESKLLFTYDKQLYNELPQFVDKLHARGQKYIIILDHALGANSSVIDRKLNGTYLPFSDGIEKRVFIYDPRNANEPLYGEVWPGLAVYPDFTLGDSVTNWWTLHSQHFWNKSTTINGVNGWGVEYDALWIDMNEPSNFVPGSTTDCDKSSKYNYPPYIPNILGANDEWAGISGRMYDKTICMDARQHWGLHYDVHSLYGHSMSITTYRTLRKLFPERRPLVLTRSNFAGTQKYATHWLGDNQSQWRQIPWSIVGMLEYSLFGFSFTGADICGFFFNTTEQMCQRWTQLGAFYPYSRNHNAADMIDQDPAAFSEQMIRVTRDVLMTRYKLLPFLYTLLHMAHTEGSTVVRPLLHEFPTDPIALTIDRQFLWGSSFLISAVLEEDVSVLEMYLPATRWYDYYEGTRVDSRGSFYNMTTPLDKIQLHVRAGSIIPWQRPANTTVYSRQNPMGLLVALEPAPSYKAHGSLFWDDGESFETFQNGNYLLVQFNATADSLTLNVVNNGYPEADNLFFSDINIWGFDRAVTDLQVDGTPFTSYTIDQLKNVHVTNLNMTITSSHTLSWQFVP